MPVIRIPLQAVLGLWRSPEPWNWPSLQPTPSVLSTFQTNLPTCGRFYLSARVPVLLRQKVPQYENHLSYQALMDFYRFLKIWADVMHSDWCDLMRANDRGIRWEEGEGWEGEQQLIQCSHPLFSSAHLSHTTILCSGSSLDRDQSAYNCSLSRWELSGQRVSNSIGKPSMKPGAEVSRRSCRWLWESNKSSGFLSHGLVGKYDTIQIHGLVGFALQKKTKYKATPF